MITAIRFIVVCPLGSHEPLNQFSFLGKPHIGTQYGFRQVFAMVLGYLYVTFLIHRIVSPYMFGAQKRDNNIFLLKMQIIKKHYSFFGFL